MFVVVSKIRRIIKESANYNTSSKAISVLSQHNADVCVEAAKVASENGRKTVLDRDITEALLRVVGV